MIILAIVALSGVVLAVLWQVLGSMPVIDTGWLSYLTTAAGYIGQGIKFVNAFTHAEIVLPLALLCVALHAFWEGYRIVMWVVKKIPMFGIGD